MAKPSAAIESALKEKEPKESAAEEVQELSVETEEDDAPEPVQRETRDDKKRERGRRFNEEREREREERAALLSQNERLLRELELTRRQPAATEKAPSFEDDEKVKEIRSRAERLRRERRLLGERIALRGDKMSSEEQEKIIREADEIDEQIYETRADLRDRKAELSRPREDPRDEVISHLRSKYHHVLRNPSAARFALGTYQMLVARGKSEGPDTVEEAYREAEREFRLGTGHEASAGQRAKYAGTPVGSASGGRDAPRTIRMTEERKKQADAAFGHIKDEAKRYEMFAKKVGPRILERENAKK